MTRDLTIINYIFFFGLTIVVGVKLIKECIFKVFMNIKWYLNSYSVVFLEFTSCSVIFC